MMIADDDPHLRFDVDWCPECWESCGVRIAVISYEPTPSEIEVFCDTEASEELVARIHDRHSETTE